MEAKKYGSESNEHSKVSRIREENDLNFPDWDSLPATAGLTNAEAFQLSIVHAHALLPLVAKQAGFDHPPRNPERFRL
jgi:hypothetical protein